MTVDINNISSIKFDSRGLVPAIAQDITSGQVLMLAYMNMEALEKTLWSGKAHYYSRSRKKLWLKGETSGNFQTVKAVRYDCDADTLLLMIDPAGPACHTGEQSCFYRTLYGTGEAEGGWGAGGSAVGGAVIERVYNVLRERKKSPPEKSYVAALYSKGLPKILEKVREESAELMEAAAEKEKGEIIHELTDLWFHTMVLLSYKDIGIEEVFGEFERRFGTSGIEEKNARHKKDGGAK